MLTTGASSNGISLSACQSIAKYLSSSNCALESIYISNNPIGNVGAQALSSGLAGNASLLRLSARSTGLGNHGAIAVLSSLASHPCLMTLDLGQSYATEDLGMRYNYFDDRIIPAAQQFLASSQTVQYLDISLGEFSTGALKIIYHAALRSQTLLAFKAETLLRTTEKELKACKDLKKM